MKENIGNHYNCIYMYINRINEKRYVGQAKDFNKRHKAHITCSYNENIKYDYNFPFHRAIRKYGIENFKIQILAENIPTQEKMNEYEIFFIKRYNTLCKNGNGYNIASGGSNGNNFAGKTEEEMEEFKQKISEAKKGIKLSEKHKQKLSKTKSGENNPMYGKHHSEETIQKMSKVKSGENNYMYGKHHSEETRRKISESQSIKISQYDKQTHELIRIWNGSYEIERELGIHQTNVIACCKWYKCGENLNEWHKTHKKHPYKSAGGFVWKYYEEDNKDE